MLFLAESKQAITIEDITKYVENSDIERKVDVLDYIESITPLLFIPSNDDAKKQCEAYIKKINVKKYELLLAY
jgi:hypothetical protein